jgi:hypothetical protein
LREFVANPLEGSLALVVVAVAVEAVVVAA